MMTQLFFHPYAKYLSVTALQFIASRLARLNSFSPDIVSWLLLHAEEFKNIDSIPFRVRVDLIEKKRNIIQLSDGKILYFPASIYKMPNYAAFMNAL